MASPVDPVLGNHTSQERQPAAVPELLNHQPHQLSTKSHGADPTEQIEAASGEDITEEQACFAAERSTTEQIFKLRIPCEKHLQHQQGSVTRLIGVFSPFNGKGLYQG